MKRSFFLACLVLLGLTAFVQAEQGNPKIKTIEAIAFGPDGLLLIGGGAQVVTVETGDTKEIAWSKTEIAGIDQLLAGKLGMTAKDLQIQKIAVNPASRKAYIAVRNLKAKQDVILTVDGAGKVEEFSLENVKFNRYPLTTDKAITKVTDICWAGKSIVAATQATDTFASRVFSITPGSKETTPVSFATETYHTGHGGWETKAPILCIMPYEEKGKTNVVGSFTCTPIVKYPLEDMQPNAKVKGVSVVELGQGNQPRSMFTYEKDGKKFILINTFRKFNKGGAVGPSPYWVAKVDFTLLAETTNINEKALWRVDQKGKASVSVTDRAIIANDYFGVQQMDRLDATRALVIREDKGGLSLRTLALP
jgi:hypothetical protein